MKACSYISPLARPGKCRLRPSQGGRFAKQQGPLVVTHAHPHRPGPADTVCGECGFYVCGCAQNHAPENVIVALTPPKPAHPKPEIADKFPCFCCYIDWRGSAIFKLFHGHGDLTDETCRLAGAIGEECDQCGVNGLELYVHVDSSHFCWVSNSAHAKRGSPNTTAWLWGGDANNHEEISRVVRLWAEAADPIAEPATAAEP